MPPDFANGKICYLEIPAADIDRSADFYTAVFGWETRRRGDGSLAFDDNVQQVSGVWVTGRAPSPEAGLLIYIMVADAQETVDAIISNGGVITQPVSTDSPNVTARFRDPFGNVLGIFEEPALRTGT